MDTKAMIDDIRKEVKELKDPAIAVWQTRCQILLDKVELLEHSNADLEHNRKLLSDEKQQLLDENERSWKIAEDYKDKMVEANKKNYRLGREVEQLQADKAVAVEALRWYADKENYEFPEVGDYQVENPPAWDDGGGVARRALERIESGEKG